MVDWHDGGVEDTDELRVAADSAAEAESLVRNIWSATNRAAWRHSRITGVVCVEAKSFKKWLRQFA